MPKTLPRLRALEILHVDDDQGNPAFLLRDPMGYSSDEILLSEAALFVASYLDGAHSMDDLRSSFDQRYRTTVDSENIESLIEQLNAAYFLENETFSQQRAHVEKQFLEARTRRPAHAGAAYPKDREACLNAVSGHFEAAQALRGQKPWPPGDLLGLVAPHIDLRVGGPTTALAYAALSHAPKAETVVVLGTSHACVEPWIIVSEKQYNTPLGPVPTNIPLARTLREATAAPTGSEVFHIKEHSVELQAVFLAAMQASGRTLSMVPVLCGSLRESVPSNREQTFWKTLRKEVGRDPGRIVVLAAADLAHVGPRFGDEKLDANHLKLLEKKDRDTLSIVERGLGDAFFENVTAQGDPRRICGLSPIFGLLQSLPPACPGELLRYEQATDDTGTVSYAGMGFWAKS